MQGWIKLHRKIQDHWLYQEKRKFSRFEAWLDLLMMVNHEDKKVVIGTEMVEVKRGQRITSVRQLCDRWGWSNTKVTQFLKLLQNDGMLHLKSDSKKTVITIDNYDFYQGGEDKETTENRRKNDTKQTQKHTNKNDKELIKNDEEDIKTSCRKSKTYDEDSSYYKLSLRLFKNIRQNNQEFKEPNLQKWSNDFRLMAEADKRTIEQITYLVDWCQQDAFWHKNILSPSKLRKQFDRLVMEATSNKKGHRKSSAHSFPTERPSNWQEPQELSNGEYLEMKKWEDEFPF